MHCRSQNVSHALIALVVLALAMSAQRLVAVDFELDSEQSLTPGEVLIGINQELVVELGIDNEATDPALSIQGFQMAISHDDSFLQFVSGGWEGTDLDTPQLRDGAGPEFYNVEETAGGVTIGAVFDLQDVQSFLLGQGEFVVGRLNYLGTQSTAEGESTPLEFAPELNDPAVENKYETRDGQVLDPDQTQGLDVFVGGEVAYAIHFDSSSVNGDPQDSITLPLTLVNNPLPVTGFSFGLNYDSDVVQLDALRFASGLTDVMPVPDASYPFFAQETVTDNTGKEVGVTVALLLSDSEDVRFLDPIQSPHTIFELDLTLVGADGTSTVVDIVGDLGDPAVDYVFDLSGTSQEPVVPSTNPPSSVFVQVGMGTGVDFIRGDVDQNGKVNITDVINNLRWQFAAVMVGNPTVLETAEFCTGAFDIDASDSVEVTDPVALLTFLFLQGPTLPAPFPDCGSAGEGVPPALVCQQFTCR